MFDLRWWLLTRLILPVRWHRAHLRDARDQRQMCKVCGQTQEVDFIVSDETWAAVVPKRWNGRVVCLRCFERFAADRGQRCLRVFLPNP